MSRNNPSFVASADIKVSRFVKITGEHTAATAAANEVCIGVSHEGAQDAAIPPYVTTAMVDQLAARSGTSCRVYGDGEVCEVYAGAAITAGATLKSDANGKAIPTATGNPYFAVALGAAAAADEKVKVVVLRGNAP